MKRFSLLAIAAAAVIAAPLVAGPPVKRPSCQPPKVAGRDVRRSEPCRTPPVPPLVDPTPMYLVSTAGRTPLSSDLS
jgi:hypothetical protein